MKLCTKHAVKKRNAEKMLAPLSKFVLQEAIELRRIRTKSTGIMWHVDHIHPVSLGGSSKYHNLQVVPAKWNQQKSNKHQERYIPII